jgi:hypothetical protein
MEVSFGAIKAKHFIPLPPARLREELEERERQAFI